MDFFLRASAQDDPVQDASLRGPSHATVLRDSPMMADQAARLRELAADALEPEAFNPNLTAREATLRIHMFEAKLRLQDGAPHTI